MVNNTVLGGGPARSSRLRRVWRSSFVGGESRADKRRAAVKKPEARRRNAAAGRHARRRRSRSPTASRSWRRSRKRKGPDLATRIEQAGLPIDTQQFLIDLRGDRRRARRPRPTSSPASLLLGGPGRRDGGARPAQFRARRGFAQRRINKFIAIFPNALDIIVRGVKAGLPLGDTLRIIANESPEPVRSRISQDRRGAGARPAAAGSGREDGPARAGQRDEFLLDRHRHPEQGGRQPVRGDRQPVAHPARAQEDEGQDRARCRWRRRPPR